MWIIYFDCLFLSYLLIKADVWQTLPLLHFSILQQNQYSQGEPYYWVLSKKNLIKNPHIYDEWETKYVIKGKENKIK